VFGVGRERAMLSPWKPSVVGGVLVLLTSLGSSVPSVQLNNGIEMPVIAFAAETWDSKTCENATGLALQAGFRFIWSSALVGNACQMAQQSAMAKSGIPRSELFVAGTVADPTCKGATACYEQTSRGAEAQFALLQEDVLDMLMLDYPAKANCDSIRGQWRAFEELYAAKRVRSIAVSNFSPDQLLCILQDRRSTVPVANQMPYSVGHGQDPVVADAGKYGVVVQAYSPLGGAFGPLARDPLCSSIGKHHGKSSAQVALRWILQHNVTIATQSTKLEHLQSDLALFDFQLSHEEMHQLDAYTPAAALVV